MLGDDRAEHGDVRPAEGALLLLGAAVERAAAQLGADEGVE
jgi:hypothetical protein